MKVALLLALAFVSCQSDFMTKGIPCKDFTVSLSDTFHQDGEKYNVFFTTYKVNEPRYNPTRYLINEKKVADSYNVPAVVSLSDKYEKLLDAKPNDTIVVEINGTKSYYLFQDRMSNKKKYRGRADILINRDAPHWKAIGKIYKKV